MPFAQHVQLVGDNNGIMHADNTKFAEVGSYAWMPCAQNKVKF